jgi:hypothetical protein
MLFFLAQLEVEIIKKLERSDLLRFYDYYISPRSINRRKLALHVNPSALAFQKPISAVASEDELAVMTGEELPSTADKEQTEAAIAIIPELSQAVKLTEQPIIIDTLTGTNSNEATTVLPKKEINLPKVKSFIININLYFSFQDRMD